MADRSEAPVSRRVGRVAMVSLHTSPTASLGKSANGGLIVYVRELCAAFSRRGIATDVFTRTVDGRAPAYEQIAPLSRVIYLPAGPPGLDKYRLLDQVPAFIDHMQEFIERSGTAYDVLYSHYWLSGLVACALRRRLCVPWAHTAHTLAIVKNRQLAPGARPEPEVRVELEGEIAHCADLLVVSTAAEGDDLRHAYHVRPERLAEVAPGVDLDTFRPVEKAAARALIGRPEDRIFVFAGRLEPLKGVDVILHAVALVTAGGRHPEARLLVLGDDSGDEYADDGAEHYRLQRITRELGIEGQVEFLGSIPQRRLPTYYAAADACLMPSYSESFGLVGLEAQACGTAVVASNLPGLASFVRDGVTGFLVDGPDPEAYADRVLRLLEEPELAERLGRRGSRLAERFSWERTADRILVRFERLVAPGQVGVQATALQE